MGLPPTIAPELTDLLLDENDNVRLAIGGSGGSRIISGVAYVSISSNL